MNSVEYQCGQCRKNTKINEKDSIKCKECGYRILYKLRTKKPTEYAAR